MRSILAQWFDLTQLEWQFPPTESPNPSDATQAPASSTPAPSAWRREAEAELPVLLEAQETSRDPVMTPALHACHQPNPKQASKKGTGTRLMVSSYPTVGSCSEPWSVSCNNWALSGATCTDCPLMVPALKCLG